MNINVMFLKYISKLIRASGFGCARFFRMFEILSAWQLFFFCDLGLDGVFEKLQSLSLANNWNKI